MLYLEDYVEMIEHLPQELRDRFTEMREMDLGVQNNMDTLEKRVRSLFTSCRRNEITSEQANSEFSDIRKGYNRTLEEADEKVNLANQMYELVDRYLRRLDTEIYKIKCELEADNKGITEVLEKRSLELDMPATVNSVNQANYHKENRYRQRERAEKRRDSWGGAGGMTVGTVGGGAVGGRPAVEGRTLVAATAPLALSRNESAIQAALSRGLTEVVGGSTMGYALAHVGAGTAIAAAASQAIVATQNMQQGRRTASLKASYDAINAAAAAALSGTGLSISSGPINVNTNIVNVALHSTIHHEPHSTLAHHTQGHHSSSHHTSSHHSSSHHSSSHHGSASTSSANKRHKKKASSSYSNAVSSVSNLAQNLAGTPTASRSSSPNLGIGVNSAAVASSSLSLGAEEALTDGEWSFDPNEPRYCICNQVSYGDMVACDNEDCPFEWFHYACVGVTAPPKGKWYCPQCSTTISMRRNRGNRKN